jgi:Tol biopolymer transport system component
MKKWQYLLAIYTILGVTSVVAPVRADSPPTCPPFPAVEVAGTETRLLPANYDVWAFEWSPDGKTAVFSGKIQGEVSTRMRIWLWPLEPTSNPVVFTNTETLTDYSPRWSPDGRRLAMARVSQRKAGALSNLWLKEVADGTGRQLTSGGQDREPFWSPDGTRIVFCRGRGPYQSQLLIYNLASGAVETLRDQEGEIVNSPWWGRNGMIYFSRLTPFSKNVTVSGKVYQVKEFGKGSIWAVNPADQTLEPVVVDEYDNRIPALSPDGNKLAFVSDRFQGKDGNGKYDRGSLYIKDLVTGEIRFITNKVGLNGGSLSWSPDGRCLAFFTFRSIRPSVWVINLAPAPPVGPASNPGANQLPAQSS